MTLEDDGFQGSNAAVRELYEEMTPKEIRDEVDPWKRGELLKAWEESEEGKECKAALDKIFDDVMEAQDRNIEKREKVQRCRVAPDGTFRLDDVPEGKWQLTVTLSSPPPGESKPIGSLEHEFTVAAVPGGVSDEPMDIGTLNIGRLNSLPQVGEATSGFELMKIEPIPAEGKFQYKGKLRLSDYKGKYVILVFWAMWCEPSEKKLPEHKTLYAKIKDDDRFVMIGISLDTGSEEQLGKYIAEHKMPWLHGLSDYFSTDAAKTYGIESTPTLLLLAPDGKVLLSNPSTAELTVKIEALRKL
jgi:peroxiredoxin